MIGKYLDGIVLNGRSVDGKNNNFLLQKSVVDNILVRKGVLSYSFSAGNISVHYNYSRLFLKVNCNLTPMPANESINIDLLPKKKKDKKHMSFT